MIYWQRGLPWPPQVVVPVAGYTWVSLVPVSYTHLSRGTPVEVLKSVAESDLIIATGNLEIHYRAGYSGGYKGLMPGVCSKKTVQTNHEWKFRPGSGPGVNDGNPMREDIEEVGKMAGVSFILNVVLNSRKEIVKAVAGHPIKAHREGCTYIDRMLSLIHIFM